MVLHQKFSVTEPLESNIAMAVVLLHAIHADKKFTEQEEYLLKFLISKNPIFCSESEKEDNRILRQARSILVHSKKTLEDCIHVLDQQQREITLLMAVEAVCSDSDLAESEKAFLERLNQLVGAEDGLLEKALEVFYKLYQIKVI